MRRIDRYRVVTWVTIAGVAAIASACGSRSPRPALGSSTPSFLETPVPPRPAASGSVVRARQLYEINCAQCHGIAGDGKGYGAPFLVPPPRDFTSGQFRFRTTPSGALPTDEDLFRIISRGANGTGMPPWQHLLNEEDRWALVDYVKSLSGRFASGPPPRPLDLPGPPSGERSVNRGRAAYERMQCGKCHGSDGRGVGPSALTLVDSSGRHSNSRDLTNPGSFRTGWSEREILRTLETGMNGSPMPSYQGTMSAHEEYDLVAYVMSLAKHGSGDQRRQAARSMEGLSQPDRIISIREHAWKFQPAEIHIKRSEVVRVEFSVTDNGLGAGHGFALDGYDQQVFINGAMVGAPLSVTFMIDKPGRYRYYCATQCSTTELHPHMNGVLIVE